MRETFRQTYTSLEIGKMKEENEQLKRRLEKAIEYIKDIENSDFLDTTICMKELLLILNGEDEWKSYLL